ncbi:unnamed protein product [Eruca vesicaria subsp. sativa]|uniref:Uncharacterized protein n=1 Tax=Eruca vesicaria subsp. sativa TaxID=29727 RepID=A0ABC8K6U1_ERUVS|nr:unnamed protein product [Eruca vesicaria subsp. sativa]
MEIIQLNDDDDDDEMVDTFQDGVTSNGTQGPPGDAPSVLWDVGLDLLEYPEYYNNQRNVCHVTEDTEFWNGIIEENFQTIGGVQAIPTTMKSLMG